MREDEKRRGEDTLLKMNGWTREEMRENTKRRCEKDDKREER